MAEVTELVTKFSFEGNLSPLSDFNSSLGKSIGLLGAGVVALGAASVAMLKFADTQIQAVAPLGNLSRETGVAVEKIQELTFVAEQSGSSFDAVSSTITGLSQKIGDAAQKGSEDFSRLGISVRDNNGHVKDSAQILDEVRHSFSRLGLSMGEQRSFAAALGIDPSMLQLLGKTDAQIGSLTARARELGIVTQEQAEAAVDYSDAVAELEFSLDSVKRLMAVGVAPQMTRLVEGFTDLIAENRDWIVNGLKVTVELAGAFLESLVRLAPVIGVFVAGLVVAKVAALGLATVLGAIFSPAILIAGAIALLLLVVDDLIVAFNGGESVIASFFDEFLGFDVVALIQSWVDVFTSGFSAIGNLLTGNFDAAFVDIENAFGSLIDAMFMPLKAFLDFAFEGFDGLSGVVGSIGEFFGIGGDISPEQQAIRPSAGGGSVATDNRSVSQSNNITIMTDSPEAAGRAVADRLQGQLVNADAQLARGGV